jgi:hypothetical protein
MTGNIYRAEKEEVAGLARANPPDGCWHDDCPLAHKCPSPMKPGKGGVADGR